MRRSRATLTLYAAFGCLGYLLNGLGVVLPELRGELGLSRAEVALYPSAFALGLLAVGVAGERLAGALGRRALPTALATLGGGALLLTSGAGRVLCGVGALLLGVGGAGLVQLVPAGLRVEHDRRAAAAIGEANAVASAASVLAPLLVGAALRAGLGWRAGYLVLPLTAAAALIVWLTRARVAQRPTAARSRSVDHAQPAPRAFLGRWLDVLLVVAAEFCLVFWSADFLHSERGVTPGTAATGATLFLLGMATGRAAAVPVTRRVPAPSRLLAGAAGLATAGFALLWAVDRPLVAAAGLLLAGLGVALLYPVALAEALAAWPDAERAAARCALASGLAIGAAPLLLGALADTIGLRGAFLLTPLLLLAVLARCTMRLSTVGSARS